MSVIVIRQKKLVNAFIQAQATSPDTAVTFEQLGFHNTWYFEKMTRFGVFIPTQNQKYYLDLAKAQQYHTAQKTRAITMIALVLLATLIVCAIASLVN